MAFSATQHAVFNAFKYSLGRGDIKGRNYRNLKVYLTDSNFYNTNWRRMKGRVYDKAVDAEQKLAENYNTIRLKDLKRPYEWYYTPNAETKPIKKGSSSQIYPTNLTLAACILDSYNKESESTPTATYEGLMKMPASSKIFSTENNNSWVTGDLDWVSATNLLDNNLRTYFKNEYGFSDDYNKTEYQSFGLSENKLSENVIRLSAVSFILDSNKPAASSAAMNAGAGGLLITYQDPENGITGDEEIPVSFYDFGKTLHSNFNFLQVDWHENGVIKAE